MKTDFDARETFLISMRNGEETNRVRVRAHVKSVGRKGDPLEQIVTRLSLEPGVKAIRWEIVSALDGGEGILGPVIDEESKA